MATSTRERPILFNAEMVRAILDGRKTQTRRPLRPQPEFVDGERYRIKTGAKTYFSMLAGGTLEEQAGICARMLTCPFGVAGDRLWVRETWCSHWSVHSPEHELNNGAERVITDAKVRQDSGSVATATQDNPLFAYYRATFGDDPPHSHLKWTPSIHMPRWASRIDLLVKAVRVERVRDISVDGAEAEGMLIPSQRDGMHPPLVDQFRALWSVTYAKRGLGWQANPWVWVVEFERGHVDE